jgi:hypothetical protein
VENLWTVCIQNLFFLEHAGELRIIILRRKKGRACTTPPHTHTQNVSSHISCHWKTNLSRPRLFLTTWVLCHQEGNPLGSSQLPCFFLLLSLEYGSSQDRGYSIEYTLVVMLPQGPSPQNDQWVKALLDWSQRFLIYLTPPIYILSVLQLCASSWRWTHWRKLNKKCLGNTHDSNRWSMSSYSWSQRGHFSRWSSPLFANQSAVQHLLSATSQTKNRHLAGAQVLHTLSKGSNLTDS